MAPTYSQLIGSNELIQIVDTAVADAYRRGGPHLVCKPGCSQCCIGVFPIAHQDADRLHTGLLTLDKSDPEKAARIRTRTAAGLVWIRKSKRNAYAAR